MNATAAPPARVLGNRARCPFARVVQDATGLGAEWSWDAADRVLANGGNFSTL